MSAKDHPIDQSELRRLLHYDPETGVFTWRGTGKGRSSDQAGTITNHGYRRICVAYTRCQAHRLAFLYMEGEWPEGDVDHINGDRSDNRWCNLRCVPRTLNARNGTRSSSNKSGVTGVSWAESDQKWRATIHVDYRTIQIGRFTDFDEAVSARKEAEKRYGFHANHGRDSHV